MQAGRARPTPWLQGLAVCLVQVQPHPVPAQASLAHLPPTAASPLDKTRAPLERQVSTSIIVSV